MTSGISHLPELRSSRMPTPKPPILPSHWGTIDAPRFPPFNGDPAKFRELLVNTERLQILAPGQPYNLVRIKKA
jgi:hypothetical protein